MPNVNELHRQAWAEYQELELAIHGRIPKGEKERILRRMRVLERELDIEGRDYNKVGFRALTPTSPAHAAVLEDLARRIDDE